MRATAENLTSSLRINVQVSLLEDCEAVLSLPSRRDWLREALSATGA